MFTVKNSALYLMSLLKKIKRKWAKIRLQPIQVFCLHHVCAEYDAESMNPSDWMEIDEFRSKVVAMQKDGVEFISLLESYSHISKDWFRGRKYVVITFDDGYASLKEILPWLEDKHVPATLFINGKYLDGASYRKTPKEQYLTQNELFSLTSSFIEIGSHGWEHTDASKMTEVDFAESIDKNVAVLSAHPRYVPFHAYTWGRHTDASDKVLTNNNIIPVLIDGIKNFNDRLFIHREVISEY